MIVKDDTRTFHERVSEVYRLVKKDIAADFIVLTPQEYNRSRKTNPFIGEIESTGRILYG